MFDELLARAALLIAIASGAPLIVSSLVGLVIGILQAATQIQEQTTLYVVKLAAVTVVIGCSAPWFANEAIQLLHAAINIFPALEHAALTP